MVGVGLTKYMKPEDITKFVKKNIEPLPAIKPYGLRYRVSAILTDGTNLPCVVIESVKNVVELSIRRFDEEKNGGARAILRGGKGDYPGIVKSFVTSGNRVNHYDITSLEASRFAIPLLRLQEVKGETSLGWTEFYATMNDGKEFHFGTTFFTEFFDMPSGYSATDLMKVIPAVRGEEPRREIIYREKPFFTCYIDGI